jgi:hypothetical protein
VTKIELAQNLSDITFKVKNGKFITILSDPTNVEQKIVSSVVLSSLYEIESIDEKNRILSTSTEKWRKDFELALSITANKLCN